jgi:hypothetical protein
VLRRGGRARNLGRAALFAVARVSAGASIARADATPASDANVPTQEVTVHGTRARDPGAETLTRNDAREIPGAFGDPFRALDALPGVAPVASGLPFFFVRGAPPGNVGTFIDGVRVPLLYHFALGPSVVHPALIDRVDFYPGGYPARFGRFSGAVLSGDLTPPQDRFHGEANVRAFDAGALAEAPFDDGRGHALVAGRYGYPGLVVPLFAPDTHLAYGDYQTRETFALTDRDSVSVFAFGSYDNLEQRDSSSAPFKEVLGMQFNRVDLRYDRALPNGGHARIAVTVGADASRDDQTRVTDFMTAVRSEVDAPIDSRLRVRGGADVTLDHYGLDDSTLSYAVLLYPARDDVEAGAWADAVWNPAPGVQITPGLRADLFDSKRLGALPALPPGFDVGQLTMARNDADTAIPTVDPRLAVRVLVTRDAAYTATFGVAHQRPSFFVPVPGLQISQLSTSLQSSVEASQGIEVALPWQITASVTGFLRGDYGLSDLSATCPSADQLNDVRSLCADDPVRGRAFGGELFVRRSLARRLTGWLSYTLSRAERQASVPGVRGDVATWIPSEFDRTHVLSAIAAYDLGRGWRAGGRFYYDTGRPYSQTSGGTPIPPFDGFRLPAFWRVDLRLEKQWRLSSTTRISMVAEGMNVTLNKEALSIQCAPSQTSRVDVCRPSYIGPITVPSIGAEVSW